eukprot:1157925-Pelagomonas_calceolata.AAC.9
MPVGDMWLLRWSSADGEVRGMRTQVHGRAGSGLYSPICTDPFLKAEDDENKGADGGADDGAAAAADGILAAESLVLGYPEDPQIIPHIVRIAPPKHHHTVGTTAIITTDMTEAFAASADAGAAAAGCVKQRGVVGSEECGVHDSRVAVPAWPAMRVTC